MILLLAIIVITSFQESSLGWMAGLVVVQELPVSKDMCTASKFGWS